MCHFSGNSEDGRSRMEFPASGVAATEGDFSTPASPTLEMTVAADSGRFLGKLEMTVGDFSASSK
ncbi:MAG: hypothetical protein IJU68_07715 [Bacteroidales bacterium]|nr:hypothetical protein [Bacteroidales bacterium]